jgi:diguanylate cyclase (GGDEF)-like protein
VANNLVTLLLRNGGGSAAAVPEPVDPGAGPAETAVDDPLRRTLDEALGTLAEVLGATDAETLADTVAAIDRCRAQLALGAPADVVDPLARSCFEATRNLAVLAKNQSAEQQSQITGLVGMVREIVAAIAGDQATLDESLAGSAERFGRLVHVNNLQQIQAQLFKEVATLKRLTYERRAAWERTFKDFGSRLTTLEKQLDYTRREAAVDPLTNVANRRTFERTCREWLEPNRPGFVMAMVDVDVFKAINDQNGHAVGDQVLITVAGTLEHSLRAGDVVARLGGDEFAVLARGLTLAQAETRFTAIGRAVQEACRSLVPDGLTASISIGLAECSAGDTFSSLQLRADAALYEAKRSGKARVATKAAPLIRDLRKTREAGSRS